LRESYIYTEPTAVQKPAQYFPDQGYCTEFEKLVASSPVDQKNDTKIGQCSDNDEYPQNEDKTFMSQKQNKSFTNTTKRRTQRTTTANARKRKRQIQTSYSSPFLVQSDVLGYKIRLFLLLLLLVLVRRGYKRNEKETNSSQKGLSRLRHLTPLSRRKKTPQPTLRS
jgi:hypothetical protein